MQCLVTESRAWLFLANTVLPTQGDLLGTARDGGVDTKGDRGVSQEGPSPWLHSLESEGRAK